MPRGPKNDFTGKRKTEIPHIQTATEKAFQRLKECPATALFVDRLREQPSGTQEVYHRGLLMKDRASDKKLDRLASMYLVAADLGVGTLVQRHHGEESHEYLWVRG